MRGLIFNYLLECIESHSGYATVDTIIEASGLKDKGSYAAGGMYEDADFMQLLSLTSKTLQIPTSQILTSCGKYIFPSLYQKLLTIYNKDSYKHDTINNAFDFISRLEDIHYKEVVKLYPDSIFPHFDVINCDNSIIEFVYRSERDLPFLAKGLLEGCLEYFDESLTVEMQNSSKKGSTHFIIKKEQA